MREFIHKLFGGLIGKRPSPTAPKVAVDQPPYSQSPEFLNHNRLVDTYFDFLEQSFGFGQPTKQWIAKDYHIVYQKGALEVGIGLTCGTLPWVYVRKAISGDGELHHHIVTCIGVEKFKQVYAERALRVGPKLKQYTESINDRDIDDRSALDDDYARWGKHEHELVLLECAGVLIRHPEVLDGDLSQLIANHIDR